MEAMEIQFLWEYRRRGLTLFDIAPNKIRNHIWMRTFPGFYQTNDMHCIPHRLWEHFSLVIRMLSRSRKAHDSVFWFAYTWEGLTKKGGVCSGFIQKWRVDRMTGGHSNGIFEWMCIIIQLGTFQTMIKLKARTDCVGYQQVLNARSRRGKRSVRPVTMCCVRNTFTILLVPTIYPFRSGMGKSSIVTYRDDTRTKADYSHGR